MERADWLEEKVDSADARFLMVTAITHHRFSSPIWGAREVRKLQAELAEIAKHAAEVLKEHQAPGKEEARSRPRPPEVPWRLRRPGLVTARRRRNRRRAGPARPSLAEHGAGTATAPVRTDPDLDLAFRPRRRPG